MGSNQERKAKLGKQGILRKYHKAFEKDLLVFFFTSHLLCFSSKNLLILLLRIIVYVAIHSFWKAFKQFLLNTLQNTNGINCKGYSQMIYQVGRRQQATMNKRERIPSINSLYREEQLFQPFPVAEILFLFLSLVWSLSSPWTHNKLKHILASAEKCEQSNIHKQRSIS